MPFENQYSNNRTPVFWYTFGESPNLFLKGVENNLVTKTNSISNPKMLFLDFDKNNEKP